MVQINYFNTDLCAYIKIAINANKVLLPLVENSVSNSLLNQIILLIFIYKNLSVNRLH